MSTVYETIKNEYEVWKKKVTEDADLTAELTDMEGKEDRITDAFYQNLAFGTGGLRGVIGAGTNRMNIYTVGKASQGLADYINRHFPKEERKIAISYDSRIKSSLFAKRAAEVFAANGIRVFIYTELMPTPMLSWAVRSLSMRRRRNGNCKPRILPNTTDIKYMAGRLPDHNRCMQQKSLDASKKQMRLRM